MEAQDTRSPLKPKKQKSFKFLHKREKEEKEERKEEKRKEKVERKIDKRKEKEERRKEKEEKKRFKKDKKKKDEQDEEELPVFGVPLSLAIQRCPAHDGIQLPAIVRECIDQIEERGLHCEGIYRLSGVKSKVHQLRRLYNTGEAVRLCDQEPHVIASLLKQYLRELPEPVLTVDMMPHFEDVAMIPNPGERAEAMRQLIDHLPTANRLLLQYMFKHMGHIIARERDTKMTYQNVSIVLSPTMQISHRVLNVFFLNHAYLFGGVTIKKYIPPIGTSSSSGERSLEQLQRVSEIEAEMMKQESLLAHLHAQVTAGNVSRSKEERLWEAQRIVTLLKRKLRSAQRREEEERLCRQGGGMRQRMETLEKESTSEECECDLSSYRGGASASEDSSEGGSGGIQRQRQRFSQADTTSVTTATTTTTTTSVTTTTTNNITVISTEDSSEHDGSNSCANIDKFNAQSANISVQHSNQHAPVPSEHMSSALVEHGRVAPQTDSSVAPQVDSKVLQTVSEKTEEEIEEKEEEGKEDSESVKKEDSEGGQEEEKRKEEVLERTEESRSERGTEAEEGRRGREGEGRKERRRGEERRKEKEEEEERTNQEEQFADFKNKISTDERAPHVTLIKVVPQGAPQEDQAAVSAAARSEPPPPPRLEARRLAVEKVALRETRSLDDTKPKDSEHLALLAQEVLVVAEHEELLSMNHDLMRKLQAERAEITRLREEIQEMQTLYGYRTYSYDSSESDGSESDRESDTEEEMLTRLSHVTQANRTLQEENRALTRRIQEEREAVVQMRVRLQQAQWRDLCHDTPMAPVC